MIYANFLNSDDDNLLDSPLLEAVKSAVVSDDESDGMNMDEDSAEGATQAEKPITQEKQATLSKLSKKRHVDFTVAVECTETGEEYELPPIRLVKESCNLS
jgi:DNA segregation ATPase FtsK/SpoIIIE-like protein